MGAMDYWQQIAVALAATISCLAVAIACIVAAILCTRRKLNQRQKLPDAALHRGTTSRIQRNQSFNAQHQGISETALSTDAPFIIAGNLSTSNSGRPNPVYLDEDGLTVERNQSLRPDYSFASIPRARVGDARKTGGRGENGTSCGVVELSFGNAMTANEYEHDSASASQNRDNYDGTPTSEVTTPPEIWFTGRLSPSRSMDGLSATGTDTHLPHGTVRELHENSMLQRTASTTTSGQGQTEKGNSALRRNQSWLPLAHGNSVPEAQLERVGVHLYRINTLAVEESDEHRPDFPIRSSSSLLWRENRLLIFTEDFNDAKNILFPALNRKLEPYCI